MTAITKAGTIYVSKSAISKKYGLTRQQIERHLEPAFTEPNYMYPNQKVYYYDEAEVRAVVERLWSGVVNTPIPKPNQEDEIDEILGSGKDWDNL